MPGADVGATSVPARPQRGFPWDEVIALCLGECHMAPAVLWATTPREIAALLRGRRVLDPQAVMPLERSEFDQLRTLYPDAASPSAGDA